SARPARPGPGQHRDRNPAVAKPQNSPQPRIQHPRQTPGHRPGSSHHPSQGRRPGTDFCRWRSRGGNPPSGGLVRGPSGERGRAAGRPWQSCCRSAAMGGHCSEVNAVGTARTRGGRMVERDKRMPADEDPAINTAMAAEIERLDDELAGASEQLTATSEVLAVIGRSASDLEAVLKTVVESARKLCGADVGLVFLVDGDRYRFAYGSGMTPEYRELVTNNPVLLDRGSLAGRVVLDRRATQITDVLADPEYGRSEAQRAAGYRTIMGVPMLLDDEAVGLLELWRNQVDPFTNRAVELLTTFAAQAALAVRTV